MRSHLVRLGLVALASTAAIACSDEHKDPLAPRAPEKMILPPGSGIVIQKPVRNPDDFVEITAGDYHTCARKNNGNVYCWGVSGGPVVQVATLTWTGAKSIDAGASHTCGIEAATGHAFCWGAGNQGQLGVASGQYITYNGVQAVTGPVDPNNPYGAPLPALVFTSLSAGGNSTCGLTSGGVYCWGQLGNLPDLATPIAAPYLTSSYNGMTAVSVGSQHACGYIGWATLAYCWGADSFGQAGVDKNDPNMAGWFFPNTSIVEFAASNGLGTAVSRISAGGNFTCADQLAGTVQCFGYN